MKFIKSIVIFSIVAVFSTSVFAKKVDNARTIDFYTPEQRSQSFQPCLDIFPKRDISFTSNFPSAWRATELCSNQFAVYYSKVTKTPLVVVEKLNAYSVADAKGEDRTDNFYPDPRLKREDSASLEDYKKSSHPDVPTDRGHLSPAASSIDALSMNQSFALTNMVPQDPTNNRKIWSKLEGDVRKYVSRAAGNVYVYSGPLFQDNDRKLGKGQVWMPSYLFKLVYDEAKGQAWAWVLPNTADAKLGKPMPYSDFQKMTGLNLLKPEWVSK